jgi:acetoin utilization protein AcuB
MLVNDWMKSPVISIGSHESLQKAAGIMTQKKIGMLPVMDEGKLVGIMTDRDLKRAAPSCIEFLETKELIYRLAQVKIETVMTRNPITLLPDTTLEEAASILREHNISGCPVLDHAGELIGIITKNDIFDAFATVIGLPDRGLLLGFILEDRHGSIKEVTDVIRQFHCRLISILTTHQRAPIGYRFVHIRAFNVDRGKLPELKQELERHGKLLYVVDLRDKTRETYASY